MLLLIITLSHMTKLIFDCDYLRIKKRELEIPEIVKKKN